MRILHLTRDFPPHHRGGISAVVDGMVQALVREGLECGVVSFDGWRPYARASEPVSIVQQEQLAGFSVLRVTGPTQLNQAKEFAERIRPDLIHVHHSMLWDFVEEIRDFLEVPLIQNVHVLQAEQNRLRGIEGRTLSLESQERSLEGAHLVLAPSKSVAERLRFFYPGVADRLRVVPFGIHPVPESVVSDLDPGFVLYAGRFADIKGTAELFEAMVQVHHEEPELRWVIAGGVPENRKSERRWLKRWETLASPSLQDRVRILGWCTPGELNALYASAAVVLCPSWYETFGMVVLEAMSFGKPVVATAAGGVSELMEHGETGLLSTPGDVPGLVANILTLLGDSSLASRMGCAARASVEESWLWSAVIPDLLEVYGEFLSS